MGLLDGDRTSSTSLGLPEWLEAQVRDNLRIANEYAGGKQPDHIGAYPGYTGQRVAGMSPEELTARDIAVNTAGKYSGQMDRAGQLATAAGARFTSADAARGMNPYMENVLNEIRRHGAMERSGISAKASKAGAFGGSRAALLEGMQREGEARNVGLQQAQAYESSRNQFNTEQQRGATIAQLLGNQATQGAQVTAQDLQQLLGIGGLRRGLDQAGKDFQYQQFQEQRDWPTRMLQLRLGATQGQPLPQTTTNTAASGNSLGQLIGAGSAVAGMLGKNGFNLFGGMAAGGG